jgi:flagellin-like protein
MKGISDIIAMLLMLVITIAIAGLAYGFISGILGGRTGVVLGIEPATYCTQNDIVVYVRNDGTTKSSNVTVEARTADNVAAGNCTIPGGIDPGITSSCTITRQAGAPAGTYTLIASATGASTGRATVYCASSA